MGEEDINMRLLKFLMVLVLSAALCVSMDVFCPKNTCVRPAARATTSRALVADDALTSECVGLKDKKISPPKTWTPKEKQEVRDELEKAGWHMHACVESGPDMGSEL